MLEEVAGGKTDEGVGAVPAGPAARPRSAAARALPWLAGLALGITAAALVDRTLLASPPVEPPTLASLTYSGKDFGPSASPDGGTIAFASTRDGRSRIWIKQLATGEEVALTLGPADFAPQYSPDGTTLLFLRGGSPPYDLFRIPAVGGEPRRVASAITSAVSWSPDGRRIALTRSATSPNSPDILVSIAADGGDPREIARSPDRNLLSLRWSPDGHSIGAATSLRTNFAARQSIVAFDLSSGERQTLYEPGAGSILGGWDWNGHRSVLVAESTTQSGRGGMRLRSVSLGGASSTLMSLAQPSSWIDIAGQGRVVVDQLSLIANLGLWPRAEGADSGAPSRWLTRGTSVDRQPVFSPDGRRLAFNSDRGGDLDIWELEIESGAVRRLTLGAGDDWDPAYTADGRHLLWSSNRGGNFEVWIADSDGSGARKLSADGVDAENPTATPDGRWIVYASANPKQNGVWKIAADGTGASRVLAGTFTVPELSPDGRWISVVDLDRAQLRVVSLADGADIAAIDLAVLNVPLVQPGRSRWLPGSSTVVWLGYDPQTATSALLAQDIVAGRDTRATRRTLLVGRADVVPESFALSPDGKQLVVSANQGRSELTLVDGLRGVGR